MYNKENDYSECLSTLDDFNLNGNYINVPLRTQLVAMDKSFDGISRTALDLWGFILNRFRMSAKNGRIDAKVGKPYAIATYKSIELEFGIAHSTVAKYLTELKRYNLLRIRWTLAESHLFPIVPECLQRDPKPAAATPEVRETETSNPSRINRSFVREPSGVSKTESSYLGSTSVTDLTIKTENLNSDGDTTPVETTQAQPNLDFDLAAINAKKSAMTSKISLQRNALDMIHAFTGNDVDYFGALSGKFVMAKNKAAAEVKRHTFGQHKPNGFDRFEIDDNLNNELDETVANALTQARSKQLSIEDTGKYLFGSLVNHFYLAMMSFIGRNFSSFSSRDIPDVPIMKLV